MKRKSSPAKTSGQINEKRLAAYTAAAGAALLAAAPADAAIQYSGVVDVRVSNNNSAFIDIDGDATNDLNFWHTDLHFFNSSWNDIGDIQYKRYVSGDGFSNLNGVSFVNTYGWPSNLAQGLIIDGSNNWANNNGTLLKKLVVERYSYGTLFNTRIFYSGNFMSQGYLGIRFDPGDGAKYGWIHVATAASDRYTIDGWAYDDSGQSIVAGQTTVVPEPTGIALFAAGAATIMARRRRKTKS